jgi:adenine-specific DNA methylase
LIVDERIQDGVENRGIEPLPNLDFKFVTANSLISLQKIDQAQSSMFDDYQKIDDLKNIRDQYFNASGIEREQLKTEFVMQQKRLVDQLIKEHGFMGTAKAELTQKLTDWEPFTHKSTSWFDPEWMFGIKEGLDIVIANPPYVEFKNLDKEIKTILEKHFQTTSGKYDLYIPFYEKAVELLKNKGALTFISPTRFLHRGYGEKLRTFLLEKTAIKQILDFVDHQVFNTALTYTGVFIFQKNNKHDEKIKYIKLKQDISNQALNQLRNNDIFEVITIDQNRLGLQPWYISNDTVELLLGKIEKNKNKLDDICEGIYQGVATGKDEVFIVDRPEIDTYKIEVGLIVPFLRGKNISKYQINWKNTYLIYPYDKHGHPLEESEISNKYPNGYKYLVERKNHLKGRKYFDNSTKYWYELWNQRNLNRFYREKIITLDNARTNSFAYDDSNFVGSTTTYSLILNNVDLSYKYIIGLLNSSLLDFYHKKRTIPQAGGYFR